MTQYTVIWEIEVDADTPTEAAAEALRIQRDPESEATNFIIVREDMDRTVAEVRVDNETGKGELL